MKQDLLDLLVAMRRYSGKSGNDVGKLIGKSQHTIGRQETRVIHFGVSELAEYAAALGAKIECTVTFDGISKTVPLWDFGRPILGREPKERLDKQQAGE